MLCPWCRKATVPPGGRYCSKRCRQTAFRLRQRRGVSFGPGEPGGLLFAYFDPPYPGMAHYYADQPTYAGEVDHAALITQQRARADLAGWALSTSKKALRQLLPLMPEETTVCTWAQPKGVPAASYGVHVTSEALLIVGGRARRPGVRDFLVAQAARGGGETLTGRKPLAFCAWLFDLLGMVPGDRLEDAFPGTGIVTRAWGELSARASAAGDAQLSLLQLSRDVPGDGDEVHLYGHTPAPATSPTAGAERRPRRRLVIEDAEEQHAG